MSTSRDMDGRRRQARCSTKVAVHIPWQQSKPTLTLAPQKYSARECRTFLRLAPWLWQIARRRLEACGARLPRHSRCSLRRGYHPVQATKERDHEARGTLATG